MKCYGIELKLRRVIDVNIQGYIMAIIGFILLLFNALSYLLGWESRKSAFTILGLVFVLIGTKKARKS